MKNNLKICYFGIYNPSHTRNLQLIRGLIKNGVEVIECNSRAKSVKKYFDLLKKIFRLKNQYDVMVVGFPGQTIMPLAWLVAKWQRKKIIFDAFVSLYDSLVLDQKKYPLKSFSAWKFWFIDWLSLKLADVVLMEAQGYIDYLVKTFKISPQKCRRIFVGADEEIIYPREIKKIDNNFLIHFHGTYLPIQGIPYIVKAAKILENENVKFNIIGKLGNYKEAIDLAKKLNCQNVNFIDFVPYEKLADLMARADVCLGMFGNTAKAQRCGAFKISESLAMKKPVITADTPAIRELLTDRQNCLLCKIADSRDLAEKILELRDNAALRATLANNGYLLYKDKLTIKRLGAEFKDVCERLIN